jgi:hypothetical protein
MVFSIHSSESHHNYTLNYHHIFSFIISITGEDFYGAYDAQNFAIENSAALGVVPVPSLNLVYTEEEVGEPLNCIIL